MLNDVRDAEKGFDDMQQNKSLFFILIFIFLFSTFLTNTALATVELKVTVDILNVRSGPGLEYPVIVQISRDEHYPMLEEKNGWLKININNTEGWVANWLIEEITQSSTKSIESNVTNLNVRSGPSDSFNVINQINPGTTYPLLEQEGEWVKIQLHSNETGWVAKWLITITDNPPSEVTLQNDLITVEVDILNVRSGPSTDHAIIGKLKKGDQVEVLAVEQEWYKIKFSEEVGWIASQYASQTKSSTPDSSTQKPTIGKKVVVQSEILNMRQGPSLDDPIIDKLNKNQILVVKKSEGDWLYVSKENNPEVTGWIASWLVADYNEYLLNLPTVTILNPVTNLREGPSTEHSVVSLGNAGDLFPILDTVGDWYYIQLPDGRKAYVAGWIVAVKGLNNNISHGLDQLLQGKVIVVDPGHGGKDDGATGVHFKTLEKDVNLKVATRLQKKLEAAGAKVIMTRTRDKYLTLQQRVDISINKHANLFISVHHNTNRDHKLNGTITYYYDKEDKGLAQIVQKELIKSTKLRDLQPRYGNFFVLRENRTVAILAELAFISNYQDELTARSSQFQENAAEGLFQGVIKYYNQ